MAALQAGPPSAANLQGEKTYITQVEDASASSSASKYETELASEALAPFTPKQERKLRHRVDLRLIPALGLMYGVSLMDRKNVSNAYIAGMRVDLELGISYRYSLITLVFFVTYVIFQPPLTYLCRKIGPPIFLPGLCLLWGCIIIGFGFAKNWTTLGKSIDRSLKAIPLIVCSCPETIAWTSGGWLLSWLRLSPLNLVYFTLAYLYREALTSTGTLAMK